MGWNSKFKVFIGVLFVFMRAHAEDALVADPYELPKIVAVENKKFNPQYDVTAHLGILPIDAFYKALTVGVSYTHSFRSYLSWEVLNAEYAFPQDTNLKNDLLTHFSVRPAGILDNIDYYGVTSLIYTPIYSKHLLFNDRVVHGEFSFLASTGLAKFSSGDSAVMYGGGIILRFFKSQALSFKLDGRLYGHNGKNKSSDLILSIQFGFSFEFGDAQKNSKVKDENLAE
jgi:outer membrane beta-barrel protein